MSAKPYHAGHDGLVRIASKECDRVELLVSLSDRDNVKGADMQKVWKQHIEPILPPNVRVSYVKSPVRSVYEILGKANETLEADPAADVGEFALYSDTEDLAKNYPEKSMVKYAGTLYKGKKIIPRPIQRTETVDVSGTKMRAFLASGDKKSFMRNLPKGLDGNAVWSILTGGQQTEGLKLFKTFVAESLLR